MSNLFPTQEQEKSFNNILETLYDLGVEIQGSGFSSQKEIFYLYLRYKKDSKKVHNVLMNFNNINVNVITIGKIGNVFY